jgi:hypothetical protein
MTTDCGNIPNLVVRMQGEFLETPGLALRLDDATRRFGVDKIACEAVLTALVDANVLTKDRRGAYVRFFPRGLSKHAA